MSGQDLTGCGVLVTRPAGQADALVEAIRKAGGTAYRLPVLEIAGREPAETLRAFAALATPDIVIFVSANAVAHGLHAVSGLPAMLAAVGPATRAAIESAGAAVDIFPDGTYDSEHLLRHPALQAVRGKRVLIVRGQDGRALLGETLARRGAAVDYLAVYERRPRRPGDAELAAIEAEWQAGHIDFVVAMSAETVEQLAALLPSGIVALLRQATLVAPSARVLQTATALLPGISTVLATGPQASAIVDALCLERQNGRHP